MSKFLKKNKRKDEIVALVATESVVIKSGVVNADLHRLNVSLALRLKVATVKKTGDLVLYSTDASTKRRLLAMLPFMPMFVEQRLNPILTPLEGIEIVDNDDSIIRIKTTA